MKKRKPFRFDFANRKKSLERRRKENAFSEHIQLADHGKTKPLCDYLRDYTLPLRQEHREQLAELIHRYVHIKPRGRPAGAVDRSPRAVVKGVWKARVRDLEREWHKNHLGERLPKGLRMTFIKRVGAELAEDGDFYKIEKITTDEIRDILERGNPKRHSKSL
jgi:hypothetical protein